MRLLCRDTNSDQYKIGFVCYCSKHVSVQLYTRIRPFCLKSRIVGKSPIMTHAYNSQRSSKTPILFNTNYIYIYAFSRRFYPKRLTVHSGYTFFLSVCVPGNRTHNLCTANAMLYHWATGTQIMITRADYWLIKTIFFILFSDRNSDTGSWIILINHSVKPWLI